VIAADSDGVNSDGVNSDGMNSDAVSSRPAANPAGTGRPLYLGAYTVGAGGQAAGVGVLLHDPDSGAWTSPPAGNPESTAALPALTAAGDAPESPSFLAWHPDGRHLYAVGEVADGRVWTYDVPGAGELPRVVGSAPTGGDYPCHLSVDPTGQYVVSANYGSGSLAVHPVQPDGSLGPRSDLVQHKGSGPDPDRQSGPHAHMAVFVTETLLLAVDLGVDGVAAYRLDGETGRLSPAQVPWSVLPAGFGPRHLVVLPRDLIALAGELSGEIALLRLDPETGALSLLGVERASASPLPTAPSGIVRTSDGRFVVIANRGPDTLASFAVEDHPGGAHLRSVDEIGCGGARPRAVTIVDDLLYVANERAGNIAVLRIDEATGSLADTGSRIDTPTPTHVLPYPDARPTPVAQPTPAPNPGRQPPSQEAP
jgi:6-phosphogluconolactonase (cycloisomerase 2 family)